MFWMCLEVQLELIEHSGLFRILRFRAKPDMSPAHDKRHIRIPSFSHWALFS